MLVSPISYSSDFSWDAQRFPVTHFSAPEELSCLVGTFRNYVELAYRLHLQHGFAFRTRLPKRTLNLAHPKHIYRVLRSHVTNYPKSEDYDFLRPLLGNGIFVSDGDFWVRQRRLLSPEFRPGAVSRFLPGLVEVIESLFAEWDSKPDRDITDDMMRLTLWGVGGALFHTDFRSEAEQIGHALAVCLEQGTLLMMSMGMLKSWMPTPGNRRAQQAERDLNQIVQKLIAQTKAGGDGGSMLARLLQAKDDETGEAMSEMQLVDEVKSLILAGHETTSLTLSWALYLLSYHDQIFAKLKEEAQRVLGKRTPTVEDIPKLTYTRMILLETMRLYPPVPTVTRVAREADSFDGIEVAKHDRVAISIYATHRHPEFWPNPHAFLPERFAESRAEDLIPYSYLPFLVGRRICLGEHFAMLEGVLALAMFAARYHFTRHSLEPIETHPISTLRMARPLQMRVERLPNKVQS